MSKSLRTKVLAVMELVSKVVVYIYRMSVNPAFIYTFFPFFLIFIYFGLRGTVYFHIAITYMFSLCIFVYMF